MKTTKHIIEIDAREAFMKIGLRLDESPIGAECVQSLKSYLNRSLTIDVVIGCLSDVTKKSIRPRRGKKTTEKTVAETPTGGATRHEA